MAEPSGEYDLACSVDLSPLFGKIEETAPVFITQPPADILERRLAELSSDDEKVRAAAARDLTYFQEQGERVFPALLAALEDPAESVATAALYAAGSYSEQIAQNAGVFLKLLQSDKKPQHVADRAAYYLGRFAPPSAEIEKALEGALALRPDESSRRMLEYALEQYRRRAQEKTGA